MRSCDALDDTVILGLTTNTGFLRELAASDAFANGEIDTAWLDRNQIAAPDPARRASSRPTPGSARRRRRGGPFASDGFRLGAPAAPVRVDFEDGSVVLGPPPAELPVAIVTPTASSSPTTASATSSPGPTRRPTTAPRPATAPSSPRCPAPSSTSASPRATPWRPATSSAWSRR